MCDRLVEYQKETGNNYNLEATEAGGDVLLIEAVTMKGKGELVLTGNLGDVMQESARAAVSYLRSESQALGIGEFEWKSVDIYIYVPEGAVPKDGPSAGITMATAILSAVSGRRVRPGIAMIVCSRYELPAMRRAPRKRYVHCWRTIQGRGD